MKNPLKKLILLWNCLLKRTFRLVTLRKKSDPTARNAETSKRLLLNINPKVILIYSSLGPTTAAIASSLRPKKFFWTDYSDTSSEVEYANHDYTTNSDDNKNVIIEYPEVEFSTPISEEVT